MRGKPWRDVFRKRLNRITPADAGKTFCQAFSLKTPWDHPRGCGENVCQLIHFANTLGSPPRMRGKREEGLPVRVRQRITPADAGKTDTGEKTISLSEDHPRGCGENLPMPEIKEGTLGSPPRMRGKRVPTGAAMPLPRITPADAGKTIIYHRMHSESRDHPRGCGENRTQGKTYSNSRGSPPRMRGKLAEEQSRTPVPRITPADAGKTLQPQSYRLQS